jgi:hypothetical protein
MDSSPGDLIPGVPTDLPRLDGLFRALDAAAHHNCECKPLMVALCEIANELVFINRILLNLHGHRRSGDPPITSGGQQYFVP